MNKNLRILGFILSLVLVLGAAVYGVRGVIKKDKLKEVEGYKTYSEAVLTEAKNIPLQDDGRVKPFQTWAETYMLAMHGQRGMDILVDGKKVKITPTGWLLDVIYRPEQADKLPTFRVDNSSILEEFGMEITDLRDRYSMDDLKPYLSKFDTENRLINEKIKKSGKDSLTLEEKQTIELFEVVSIYLNLRDPFVINPQDNELLQEIGLKKVSDLFGYKQKILGFAKQRPDSPMQIINGLDTLASVFNTLARQPQYFGQYSMLSFFPPANMENDTWFSAGKEYAKVASNNNQAYQLYLKQRDEFLTKAGPLDEAKAGEIFQGYFEIFTTYIDKNSIPYPEHIQEAVIQQEILNAKISSNNEASQLGAIKEFKKKYANIIHQRGEDAMIDSEVEHNDRNYFNNGLAIIILALFIVVARCMLLGTKVDKTLYWIAYAVASIATLYIITGIAHRSWIMQRPPVGTLYDTMPFIVAASLTLLLLIELIGKRGVMLAVATVLGIGGIVLAKQYEVSQATDNLSPLRAVLKSNYWLTTHVITITIGYAGGLITAAISVFYILGRAFAVIEDKADRKHLTGIVYGMVAFTLVFSLVGTILGGIWGADSWGRFWGWDPKENGALLIVIWVLIVLHARLGGFIKEMGLHCCGAFTAAIVVFSWWHVNFLGVGLHSYGFTSADAMGALWTFYAVIGILIVLGVVISVIDKEKKKIEKRAKEHAKQIADEQEL